jgi:hypothetical protein
MIDRRLPTEERHYPEPEIMPPGKEDGSEAEYRVWGRGTIEEHSIHRISVIKVGPFGLLAFLFGFLLLLIPTALRLDLCPVAECD